MLPGLKNADLEKCSHCMVSKQNRVSFKKHPPSRKFKLPELVHSDVCGPLKVKSVTSWKFLPGIFVNGAFEWLYICEYYSVYVYMYIFLAEVGILGEKIRGLG